MAARGKKEFEVLVEINGRQVVGRCLYHNGLVTVFYNGRQEGPTQAGQTPLETLARIMLRRLTG